MMVVTFLLCPLVRMFNVQIELKGHYEKIIVEHVGAVDLQPCLS